VKSDFALVVMWARVKVVSACVYVEQGGRGGCGAVPAAASGRDGGKRRGETRENRCKRTYGTLPPSDSGCYLSPRQKECRMQRNEAETSPAGNARVYRYTTARFVSQERQLGTCISFKRSPDPHALRAILKIPAHGLT